MLAAGGGRATPPREAPMRRLTVLILALVPMAVFAACDPKLEIQSTPGDGGTEGGGPIVDPPPPPPSSGDGGTGDDGGGTEGGGTEGGVMLHPFTGSSADFAMGEKFQTTSSASSYFGYVAWDSKNVYFGMQGADVASGAAAPDKWVLIYTGTPANDGTNQGIAYNCGGGTGGCAAQQPTLPFNANHHIRWKTSGYSDFQTSTGGAFVKDSLVVPAVKQNGSFVELAVTRAALGDPTKLRVHMTMLIEAPPMPTNGGWTYAGVPWTSFADGWNPTPYMHYFEFDLGDTTTAPNAYVPK